MEGSGRGVIFSFPANRFVDFVCAVYAGGQQWSSQGPGY